MVINIALFLAATPLFAVSSEVRFEQKLQAQMPEAAVIDESGAKLEFLRILRSRPAIFAFAYYKCPNLCSLVLDGLANSLRKIPLKPGKDYQVITLSINPEETPALARAKMRSYLARLGIAAEDDAIEKPWRFLTAGPTGIHRLADAAGFHFTYDQRSGEYSHPSGIIILTPSGKISRYFFGIDFPPNELASALTDAAKNKVGTLVERILLYCFHYDPQTAKYGPQILFGIRTAAAAAVIGLLFLIVRLTADERRRT